MPKKGWLQEQFKEVKKDIATWPLWMRKVGGAWRVCWLFNGAGVALNA